MKCHFLFLVASFSLLLFSSCAKLSRNNPKLSKASQEQPKELSKKHETPQGQMQKLKGQKQAGEEATGHLEMSAAPDKNGAEGGTLDANGKAKDTAMQRPNPTLSYDLAKDGASTPQEASGVKKELAKDTTVHELANELANIPAKKELAKELANTSPTDTAPGPSDVPAKVGSPNAKNELNRTVSVFEEQEDVSRPPVEEKVSDSEVSQAPSQEAVPAQATASSVATGPKLPVSPGKTNFILRPGGRDTKILEAEIFELGQAKEALEQNDYQRATGLLKKLQKSRYRQVQVRAQFLVAESFFKQKEYDLALQAYEDIIQRNAFSGLVIKTLSRLTQCAEKLGIKNKQDQYYSMLHDFFEGNEET